MIATESKVKKDTFSRPECIKQMDYHYCPGCCHGIIHNLVGQVIDELNIAGRTVGVAPVGCSVLACDYFNLDFVQAAHGRAPAVATGLKRVCPENVIFTYQGDGDLAAIGCGEIVNAAARGERITTIFVNNGIYGMTGGQMAPTTLSAQVTSTSPGGRDTLRAGMPIRVSEMLATLDGAAFIARVAVNSPKNVIKAKATIREAFLNQIDGHGFAMVEVLSTCPINWGMAPLESMKWLEQNMIPFYPLGVFKNNGRQSDDT
ncbi:MAG TPA: thiamine pyrophosphate-dependent enzyme [Ktedonobacteraceae bacterium]|nr:thiamine pyrophosphate-dependent enzyme [Ktedonobacteraceae bacterium]